VRRFKFFFIPHGPTKMCVYKGVRGLVAKMIPEKGTRWPTYFGIRPKPIWCGWTTIDYNLSYPVRDVDLVVSKSMRAYKRGYVFEDTVAAAWQYYLGGGGWYGSGENTMCWKVYGRWWRTPPVNIYVKRNWAEWRYQIGLWHYWHPGIRIDRAEFRTLNTLSLSRGTSLMAWDLGLNWLVPPGWSSVSFVPPESWQEDEYVSVKFEPDESVNSFFPCPRVGDDWPAAGYEIGRPQLWLFADAGEWEYLDIPDWIFRSPGKYWLAMVDSDGDMLPGPYLPLT